MGVEKVSKIVIRKSEPNNDHATYASIVQKGNNNKEKETDFKKKNVCI